MKQTESSRGACQDVERPIVVARPAPVYVAPVPVMPAYGGGGGYQEPSVNFNFSSPMR